MISFQALPTSTKALGLLDTGTTLRTSWRGRPLWLSAAGKERYRACYLPRWQGHCCSNPPSQTKTGLSGDSARNPSAHRVLATGFGQQLGDILTNTAARSCQAVRGGHPALGLQLKLRQQQVRRPQLRNERDSADGRCNRALHSRVSISQTPIMLRSSVSLIRP